MGHLKRIGRRKVYEGGIVDLYKDTVELPSGKIEEWDYVHHKKGAGACIVPVTEDGRILMIRQMRPVFSQAPQLELPAGARDDVSEDLMLTAKRELEEETGYTCEQMTKLVTISSAAAYCNECTHIYLASPAVRKSSQHLDEAEDIAAELFSLKDLLTMIFNGEITDGKTVAGILAYQSFLDKQDPS